MKRWKLALLSSVLAAACSRAPDGENGSVGAYSLFDPVAANPSLCGGPAIPFPNNALFADGTSPTGLTPDTTLNIPSTASTAVAANLTDGWSTTASIFTDVLGALDFSTVANSIVILEADATPRILAPGVDFTVQPSIAMAQVSGTGGCALDATVNTGAAKFQPISQQRTRILIEPLKPLAASTTYIVAVTKNLLSQDGVPATPNEFFPIVNRDTRICRLSTDTGTEILCTDPAAPATLASSIAPVLGALTAPLPTSSGVLTGASAAAARLVTLETLRRNLVRPTVLGMNSLLPAAGGSTIADDNLVIAWSFTTQSISATLATLNAISTAKAFTVASTGLSTGALGLPDTANIWAGTFDAVPYYLNDASSPNDFGSQLDYWHNNGSMTSPASGGFVPFTPLGNYDGDSNTPPTPSYCSGPPFNFVRPLSTTNCYRIPTAGGTDANGVTRGSLENLPVIITVPKTGKPTNGWPVVIFQHGITGNRSQMLAIGPTLASAGFVTIAIDLPLHGLIGPASPTNPFFQAGSERTFDLDISAGSSCLSAPTTGDGTTDPSGTCFINLGSLATTRDNLRQAVADLIHLSKSLGATGLDFDGVAGNDIDLNQTIRFAGISLGSIVGTTLLGVNTDIGPASLSVPGGGLAKLLDASANFGPIIAAGLAGGSIAGGSSGAASAFEGTDTYETFVRFAQHLSDPGDPINFATAANANHRIHMTEVIGDTVVPNSAYSNCPAASALPAGIGATATSNATVAETRLAACLAGGALVGSNSTTQAACYAGVATLGLCTKSAGQDETLISGFLSGTEPLFGQMGLTVVGPITPPGQCANQTNGAGLDVVVQFAVGTHASLLNPAGFPAVTAEMQRQTATFLASNGLTLASGGCP